MVQIDALNVNVIKVTIKDKPGLQQHHQRQSSNDEDDPNVRKAFQALRQHAAQEREVRQIRTVLETRSSSRRLRQCFATWRNNARRRALEAAKKPPSKSASNEEKIELLVEAIAERQKQQQQQQQQSEKKTTKSAPPSVGKPSLQARTLSGSKAKEISTIVAKSRMQAQKRIIEEQRARLDEQRRVIEEMRLKELDEEARRSGKETMMMARQALGQCSDQRTKRSILHLMREQGCRDKSVAEMVPQIPHTPSFLLRMEARAEIRKQRIKQTEEIHQRRREEERRREEARRREIEEQERQRQLQALKEAKRHRRELEERRKRELERNQRLEHMADRFYKRYLLRKYALEPLGSLVEEKRDYLRTAERHYGQTLLLRIFAAWKCQYLDRRSEKLQLAAEVYRRNLMWYSFADWRCFATDMKQKYQVAVDFSEMKLQSRYVAAWRALYLQAKEEEHQREMKARGHHERRLKELFFGIWRRYMAIADDVNEREHRRTEWRDLIRKFIPNDSPKWKNVTSNS